MTYLATAIILAFLLFLILRFRSKNANATILSSQQSELREEISSVAKAKIDDYMTKYEEDRLQYDLNHFLYIQFDMFSRCVASKIPIKPISSLIEIGISEDDIHKGNSYLIKKVKEIEGTDQKISWSEALKFLFDYAEINARIRGLKLLENEVANRQIFAEFLSRAEENRRDLLQRFR